MLIVQPKFKDGQPVKCIATGYQLRQIKLDPDLYYEMHPTDEIERCDGGNEGGSFDMARHGVLYAEKRVFYARRLFAGG